MRIKSHRFNTYLATVLGFLFVFGATQPAHAKHRKSIELRPIGHYQTGVFDDGATEIVAYDRITQRLFSVNSADTTIDIIDISDPTDPVFFDAIDVSQFGNNANSVAVKRGVVAIAVEAAVKQNPGSVVFYNVFGHYLNKVTVGALPDMVTFTPNGKYVLVANEGEPSDDYLVDPEGSVSIIDLRRGIRRASVRAVDFKQFNGHEEALDKAGIRIFGPGASAAQDLEPEYITVSKNSRKAWVTLQENNAVAVIDIKKAKVCDLFSLGYKDHTLPDNLLDVSNKDDTINITNWPVMGMYQPDAIASFSKEGRTFLLTANEGDARDYDGYSEEARVEDVILDLDAFPDAAKLQMEENLGRLKITNTRGQNEFDEFEELYSYGARSFSIWDTYGNLVYDSGDAFEQITADLLADNFNSTDNENGSFDNRSDDKGPEPEGIVTAKIRGRQYAFIGLERIGGIMVYDVSKPSKPEFIQYINTRDFDGIPQNGTAGDLAPEGLIVIKKAQSPIKKDLLVVAYEVSGSIRIFEIQPVRK
jgi:hypothetical protein